MSSIERILTDWCHSLIRQTDCLCEFSIEKGYVFMAITVKPSKGNFGSMYCTTCQATETAIQDAINALSKNLPILPEEESSNP
ncbi:MAG: hypothetical protein PUF62_09055 [Bacteroidales bacterium]|nr:hypothetical protein [Bacteroidales bacterium]